jgi:hypothetical protein
MVTLSIIAECCYTECCLCKVSFMLNVATNPIMLGVVMLSVMTQNEKHTSLLDYGIL